MKIGILGAGKEGVWWRKHIQTNFPTATCSLSNSDSTNVSVIRDSNVIIVAVPIRCVGVISGQIVGAASKETFVVSTCGLMEKMEHNLRSFAGDSILVHRMIGTHVSSMNGYNLAVNNSDVKNPSGWSRFVKELLDSTQANQIEISASEHDDIVGLTQALVRILMVCFGSLVAETRFDARRFGNLPFNSLLSVAARIIDLGEPLCEDIIFENPYTEKWIQKFCWKMMGIGGSQTSFDEAFHLLQRFLGDENIVYRSKFLEVLKF